MRRGATLKGQTAFQSPLCLGTPDRNFLVWCGPRFLLRHHFCIRCHFRVACHYQCMSLRSTRDLHCSLDRFSRGHNSCLFLHTVWRHYSIPVFVFTFLTPAEQFRLAWAHIVILVDRADVALRATSNLLGFDSAGVAHGLKHGGESDISTGPKAEMGEFHNFGREPST